MDGYKEYLEAYWRTLLAEDDDIDLEEELEREAEMLERYANSE